MSFTMAATSTTSTYAPHTPTHPPQTPVRQKKSTRALRKASCTASTPNLNSAYSSQPRLPATAVSRKSSLAGLSQYNTFDDIPDVPTISDIYIYESALNHPTARKMAPATPGKLSGDDIALGDTVDVPGGMQGTVRFVGNVQGKKGSFAGVELHPEFAGRGKNSGDVDGISYFGTSVPGAGIFLPIVKAVRRDSPGGSIMSSYPMTPTPHNGLKAASQNSTNFTPPTPGLPKFSASVGPGARAPSPHGRRPRTSLPRPDSPVRRTQMTPGPRPSIGNLTKTPSRYGSPTGRFSQSVRGTAGDPNKRPSRLDRKPSIGHRSASALGSFDDEPNQPGHQRPRTNGSNGSSSSFGNKGRPISRANGVNDDEVERLKAQLSDRDQQLKNQSSTLAEMESSLTELQSLIEQPDGPPKYSTTRAEENDSAQLRQMLREKNDKIAMLTAEFDAHRADFRSTIDTLEMASTETERVYEKRIEELTADVRELESRNLDVDSVASQLRQLEELVQELEEGLEDARRGEAEARGEVEFLRGEVERTRTELRREREKNAAALEKRSSGTEKSTPPKELEQKEDEIRGLKAIIHSLSRDSIPSAETRRMSMGPRGSLISNEAVENKIARDNLERQVAELHALLDKRSSRQDELERELDNVRRTSQPMPRNSVQAQRSSIRNSRDTVIMASPSQDPRSPDMGNSHRLSNSVATPESDAHSVATENSTLWCEICETGGHDILTCTNMFGPDPTKSNGQVKPTVDTTMNGRQDYNIPSNDHPAPLSPLKKTMTPTPTTSRSVIPNPMESGPVAGKESGVLDPEKWCAVCERDGHDSVDCPFEDAF